ncbi:hypothetical protein [Candidatus Amarolinea dominans]|uniref:hypothetical protein n=1 Tax=Candidatus Amarolinea dominans TaxID=3140696 RepID=UPI0031CCC0FF
MPLEREQPLEVPAAPEVDLAAVRAGRQQRAVLTQPQRGHTGKRFGEDGLAQVGAGQVDPVQVEAPQEGPPDAHAGEVSAGQVGLGVAQKVQGVAGRVAGGPG